MFMEPAPAEASEDALLDPLETLRRAVETVFPGRLTDGVPDDGVGAHADEDDDIAESSDSDSDGDNEPTAEQQEPPSAEAVMAAAMAPAAIDTGPALPVSEWRLTGDALSTAVCGQPATFFIEGFDARGQRRRNEGGDKFVVSVTGAATIRARCYDEGDGRYSVEYKPNTTGKYRLSVMKKGQHLPGSPFTVQCKASESKTNLKEWKAGRQKEAEQLRRARKLKQQEKKQQQQERLERRAPSPRINPAEQLKKAYELALAAVRADARGDADSGGGRRADGKQNRRAAARSAQVQALNQDLMAV